MIGIFCLMSAFFLANRMRWVLLFLRIGNYTCVQGDTDDIFFVCSGIEIPFHLLGPLVGPTSISILSFIIFKNVNRNVCSILFVYHIFTGCRPQYYRYF
jgi:hypothetical protein